MKRIGAYEAKTHLPRLLKEVCEGETFVITRHDAPVAILGPVEGPTARSTADVLASLKRLRGEIKSKASAQEIQEWVHEGRR